MHSVVKHNAHNGHVVAVVFTFIVRTMQQKTFGDPTHSFENLAGTLSECLLYNLLTSPVTFGSRRYQLPTVGDVLSSKLKQEVAEGSIQRVHNNGQRYLRCYE